MVWGVPSFTTKTTGETIHAAHVNAAQAAIVAAYDGHPPPARTWVAGAFHSVFSAWAGASTTAAQAANTLLFEPFWVPRAGITIDQLLLEITAAGGTLGRLGIYAGDIDTMGVVALALDVGTIATDSTGVKTLAVSPVFAPAAQTLYWLVGVFNGTPTVRVAALNNAPLGTNNAGSLRYAGYSAAHTFGALPASPPALTLIASPPLVVARVA